MSIKVGHESFASALVPCADTDKTNISNITKKSIHRIWSSISSGSSSSSVGKTAGVERPMATASALAAMGSSSSSGGSTSSSSSNSERCGCTF